MTDDATLVELARSGDQAAFGELYERYFDRVYDFLARMVREPSEAADITQDTFLRAMNSLGSLTKGGSFKSWLFTIARNTALNRLERASRTQPLEGRNDAGEEQSYDVVDPNRFGDPEEAAQAAGIASLVWEAAASLEPKHRSVLMLNLREGLDSAEIAEVMGVTKNHAYVLVNRMKSALGSAVGALALFRNGRRECAELDAVIARLQIGELTPDARRAIERHAGVCEVCQEQRRKLSSPFAIFAGFGLVAPAPGIKESIFSHVQATFSALAQQAATGPAGTSTQGSPDATTAAGASRGANGDGTSGGHSAGGGHAQASSSAGGGVSVPAGSSSRNDPWDPTPSPAGGGKGRRRRRGVAAIAAGALVLLLTGGIASLVFAGEDEGPGTTLAAAETPTETPQPSATPTPAAASTATPTSSPTADATPAGDADTPTMTPVETALASGVAPEDLATGGDGGLPQTPQPSEPGPPEPGVAAPPTVTPDAGGPPSGDASSLQQPDPPTVTPVPPSVTPRPPSITPERTAITPVPCTPSISAEPSVLKFARDSTSAVFVLRGDGCGEPLAFTAQPGSKWIAVSPVASSIPPGGVVTIAVSIDVVSIDSDSSRIRVTSAAGALDVLVEVEGDFRPPRQEGGPGGSCGVNCPPLRSGPGSLTQ